MIILLYATSKALIGVNLSGLRIVDVD